MNNGAKQQIVDKLKDANNVLITVSTNPSVDQLAACIGFTLFLNALGKHATAVFSGQAPSTLEFLKPEDTLEDNTDSLRDFIISLDKSKADKLRYKLEGDVVKVFITPYRTKISEEDLTFSHGDFNVDVVIAVGVDDRQQLDNAITEHGRILHDATIISVNNRISENNMGSINWQESEASSLCEMLADVATTIKTEALDNQTSTALLTGIVAETNRFSNDKARPHTMNTVANLMAAGASPQLVAEKLEVEVEKPALEEPTEGPVEEKKPDDGELTIRQDDPPKEEPNEPKHNDSELKIAEQEVKEDSKEPGGEIQIDQHGNLTKLSIDDLEKKVASPEKLAEGEAESTQTESNLPHIMKDPPSFDNQLTANTQTHQYSPSTDPLSSTASTSGRIIGREKNKIDRPADLPPTEQEPLEAVQHSIESSINEGQQSDNSGDTLQDLEHTVKSPHVSAGEESKGPGIIMPDFLNGSDVAGVVPGDETQNSESPVSEAQDTARDAVNNALKSVDPPPSPVAALNANPIDLEKSTAVETNLQQPDVAQQPENATPTGLSQPSYPPNLVPPPQPQSDTTASSAPASPPPPVPPPMMPPSQ